MNSLKEFEVAAIQLVATTSVENNLIAVKRLIEQAVIDGASLIVLPENFALMANNTKQLLSTAEAFGCGRLQTFLSDMARQFNVWIIGGSIPIKCDDNNKAYSSCLVFDDEGHRVASYNKLHLYDVDIPETEQRYRESDAFEPGQEIVVVESPFGRIGLSICYDIRFPELYRQMMLLGAEMMVVPSAFTKKTGDAHWSLLCQARAVENSCFIIAPNQGGVHENGRETYGHSMIVDPWGCILNEATTGEAIVMATVKKKKQQTIRSNFPAIKHGRFDYQLKRQ